VGWVAVAAMGLVVVGNIVAPGPLGGFSLERIHIANRRGSTVSGGVANCLLTAGAIGVLLAGVTSAIALIVRFLRACGEERQQRREQWKNPGILRRVSHRRSSRLGCDDHKSCSSRDKTDGRVAHSLNHRPAGEWNVRRKRHPPKRLVTDCGRNTAAPRPDLPRLDDG
jgi:hypothetical protein